MRRPHGKKGKHKSDTDHVDCPTERAQTLPRISSDSSSAGKRDGVPLSEAKEDRDEGQSPESISSGEDISSNSNSDEDQPLNIKLRRTVSEPVMVHMDELKMTSPTQKPRAKTFVERQGADAVRSPTRIVEDLENEDDGIWMQDKDKDKDKDGEDGVDVAREVELSESMSECVKMSKDVAHGEPNACDGEKVFT